MEPQLGTAAHAKRVPQLTEAPLLLHVAGLKMPSRWRGLQIPAPAIASQVLFFVHMEMPNVPRSLLKSSRKGNLRRILSSIGLPIFSAMVSTNHTHSIFQAPPAWGNYLHKSSHQFLLLPILSVFIFLWEEKISLFPK